MVELRDNRPTVKVTLPQHDNATLTLYTSLTVKQGFEIENIESESEKGLRSTLCLIKDWDFTDSDGNKLEVNEENLGKLSTEAFSVILKAIQGSEANIKKT